MKTSKKIIHHKEKISDLIILFNPIVVEPETELSEAIAILGKPGQYCRTYCHNNQINLIDYHRATLINPPDRTSDQSCLCVVNQQNLIGLVTEQNLVNIIATEDIHQKKLKVIDVMSNNLITLPESELRDIFTVVNLLNQYKIRHLPILNAQNQLVGLVTPESIRQVIQPTDLLKWRRVEEVMITKVICAPATTFLKDLAQLMTNNQVSSVVITEQKIPQINPPDPGDRDVNIQGENSENATIEVAVGIVTQRDIVQFQALELNLEQIEAEEVMSTPVVDVGPEESLWTAHQEMQRRGLRRLVVSGSGGQLRGIITQTSILQGLDPTEIYGITQSLQTQMRELKTEKIELLEQRNLLLEKQIKSQITQLSQQSSCDRLLEKIALSMRQSLHLEELLQSVVIELRMLLKIERVFVYRFDFKLPGLVISESVDQQVSSLMGKSIPETCLSNLFDQYENGWIQVIENIYQGGFTESQLDAWAELEAMAHLMVGIVPGKNLWGLLVAQQCSESRPWQDWEIELLENLSTQLAIAAHQVELEQQAETALIARKNSEIALKKEHQFVSAVLDTVGSLVLVLNRDAQILRFNKACELITEYAWEEVQDQCIWNLKLIAGNIEIEKAVFGEIINGNIPSQHETYWVTKSGDRRCILWSNTAIISPSGTVEYVIATGLDITERQLAQQQLKQLNEELEFRVKQRTLELETINIQLYEEIAQREKTQLALQEAKDQLQVVLDAVPGCISWVSADLQYFGVNQYLAKLFKLPIQAFIGQRVGSLHSDDQFAEYVEQFFASSVNKFSFEFQLSVKGDTRIYLIVAQKYHQNQAAVFVGLDITDHKQVAEALRESEERYRLVLEAMTDGIILQEASGKVLACNHRAQEILGLSKREIFQYIPGSINPQVEKKKSGFLLLNPDMEAIGEDGCPFPIEQNPLQLTLATGLPQENVIIGLKSRGKLIKWILVNSQPFFKYLISKPYAVLTCFSDVTERKLIEDKLRTSETEMRGLFAAITDIVLEIDRTGNQINVAPTNPAKLYGELTADVINQTIEALSRGKEREIWLQKIQEAIHTQKTIHFEYALCLPKPMKTGAFSGATAQNIPTNSRNSRSESIAEEFWFSASISAMSEKSVIWVARDIRESKKVEKEKTQLIKSLQESQRFVEKIVQTNPNLVYIYNLKGKVMSYVNPAITELLGYSAQKLPEIGNNFFMQLLHPEDVEKLEEHYQKCSTLENSQIREIEYRIQDIHHQWHWFYSRDTVFYRTEKGEVLQILGNAADITSRKQAEEKLQQANETLRCWIQELEVRNQDLAFLAELSDFLQACLTLEEAYNAIATLVEPMFPQSSGGVYMINAANNLVEQVSNWGTLEIGETLFAAHECWALRRGRSHWVKNSEPRLLCQHIHHQRSPIETLCVPMMAQGKSLGLLVLADEQGGQLSSAKQQLARTVAEQIALALGNLKLRETLQQQSIRDSLTGLFNRRYLEEFLERELSRCLRNQQTIGILLLDVDHFKHFNDTFGHEAGDLVLREISHVLHSHIRNSDIASRYGGEEFMVILPGSSLENSQNRAEQLRQEMKNLHLTHEDRSLGTITVSIGVVCCPEHGNTYQELFRKVDAALYEAKDQGRDRVVTAKS